MKIYKNTFNKCTCFDQPPIANAHIISGGLQPKP